MVGLLAARYSVQNIIGIKNERYKDCKACKMIVFGIGEYIESNDRLRLNNREVMKMYAREEMKDSIPSTREENHAERIDSAIKRLTESVSNFEQFVSQFHGSEKGIPDGSNNAPTPVPSYHDILLRSQEILTKARLSA